MSIIRSLIDKHVKTKSTHQLHHNCVTIYQPMAFSVSGGEESRTLDLMHAMQGALVDINKLPLELKILNTYG